jgi:flagellar biogenesis protein FliO
MTIRRSTAASPTATQPAGSSAITPGRWDLSKIPLALGGVILLILVLRGVGKRLIPGADRSKASSAVQVLVRSTIGPRQQLMLVQVGRRLVLVGSGGSDMNPLCQIEDPDEVAELIGQIRSEKRGSLPSFGAMFGRAEKVYDQEPQPPEPPAAEPAEDAQAQEQTREELSGLMERVRRIASQYQSS